MTLVPELQALLGSNRVRDHALDRAIFGTDAGIAAGEVVATVFPETTQEVAAVVGIASRHDVPIVPRGAGTGLAGGAVPAKPGVVVAVTRLNEVHEVDVVSRTAWVGPGVINLDLSEALRPAGLHFAPDPSSQKACTVGGNVATNAGGPHCLADGTTVAHILAVELVLPDASVVTVGGEIPDVPGLDLRAVVVGSEGTLGIVTRALVRLLENPPHESTLLIGFPTIDGAAKTVSDIIRAGILPAALEMMDRAMVDAVEQFVDVGYPTDADAVLLAEVSGLEEAVAADAETIAAIAERNGATTVRVAQDIDERAVMWKGRKSAFGAVAQVAPDYYLHDTVVPRTSLVDVMTRVYEIGDRYDLTMLNVFHAGDGNLHPLVAFDASQDGAAARVREAAGEMVQVSIDAGGTLSGEHGIGIEKRDFMHLVFSEADLDAQARIREAFDERGVMNPGTVLPSGSRCFDASAQNR